MSEATPKDTVESIIAKLELDVKKDVDSSITPNNSTSILGESQSEEDLLAAYGLIKKKRTE